MSQAGWTALHAAVSAGRTATVALLLDSRCALVPPLCPYSVAIAQALSPPPLCGRSDTPPPLRHTPPPSPVPDILVTPRCSHRPLCSGSAHARTTSGVTPLHYAASKGRDEVRRPRGIAPAARLSSSTAAGVSSPHVHTPHPRLPPHPSPTPFAAGQEAKLLMAAGATANASDAVGATPLHRAGTAAVFHAARGRQTHRAMTHLPPRALSWLPPMHRCPSHSPGHRWRAPCSVPRTPAVDPAAAGRRRQRQSGWPRQGHTSVRSVVRCANQRSCRCANDPTSLSDAVYAHASRGMQTHGLRGGPHGSRHDASGRRCKRGCGKRCRQDATGRVDKGGAPLATEPPHRRLDAAQATPRQSPCVSAWHSAKAARDGKC